MVEPAARRALRLLDLMPFLTSHPGISTTEVAKEFGVEKDQIIKDLTLLHMCGLPGYTPLELIDISYDDDIVHVRDPQNLDRPRNLTLAEVLIVRIALQALLDYLPTANSARKEIQALDAKLRASFSNTLPAGAVVAREGTRRSVLATISAAIEEGKKVRIHYTNIVRDEKSDRVISPFSIMVDGKKTLVHAWCDLADSQRSFVLEQIDSAEILNEVAKSKRVQSDDAITTVLQVRNGSRFHDEHGSKLKSVGSSNEMEIFQPEWLIREVLSNLGEVQVVKPGDIRELVRKRALAVRELY